MIKLSTIFWQEKNKEGKRRASMMRELLDRSLCSNTSRNSERKRGRGRSMEIEWFHGEVTRAIWRPAKELPRIKSVRILPEASNRNTRTGAKVARGGRGEEREEGKKRKRKREILKLSNPFFSFHHFGAKKQKRYRWRMRVLFAIFLRFWSSILIKWLETEKSLLKCFGIIKQLGRIRMTLCKKMSL